MKRIIRNREDDTQAEGLKHVSGTISAPNWEIQTKPACYIHLCVVSSPHCGEDYHKNSNAPLRPATLCASQASHFWKERRMKGGEEQENKRDSGYVFPFSWAFRALVTAFSLFHSAPPSFGETSPLWRAEFLWNVSQSERRLKGVCCGKACLASDSLISQ